MNIYRRIFLVSALVLFQLLQSQTTAQECSEKVYTTEENCKTFNPYFRSCIEFYTQTYYELNCYRISDTIKSEYSKDVRKIYIAYSNLYLRSDFFSNFTNVKSITIQNGDIKNITLDTFDNLRNLESLSFTENHINVLYKRPFITKGKLQTLDLSRNGISVVEADFLKPFIFLKTFSLNANNILDASSLLNYCGTLNSLTLSNNKIQRVEFTPGCSKLKRLSLNSNSITEFNVKLNETSVLEYLYLSMNKIGKVDGDTFKNFNALKELDLSYNPLFKLGDIPVNLFQNKPKLKYLNLSETGVLNIIVGTFTKLFALEILDLSHNDLRILAKPLFCDLTKIRKIFLNDNYLRQFEYDCKRNGSTIINLINNLFDCETLSDIAQVLSEKAVFLQRETYDKSNILGVTCLENVKRTSNLRDITEKSDPNAFNKIQEDLHQILVQQEHLLNTSEIFFEYVKHETEGMNDLHSSFRSMVVGVYFILFILIAGLVLVLLMFYKKYKIVKKPEEELRSLNNFET